jgi:membrane protein DedA with SNARE-associated domain
VTKLLIDYGLVLLFVLVAVESAGVPLPGETAVITAAVLARPEHHHYSLLWVIVVAASAAIVGDTRNYAAKALPPSERFFRRHGAKAVFFGRFIALLRVTAAWLAGISHMPWWRFTAWNAAGGIVWATGVSLLAYWAGKAVAEAVSHYGLYAVVVLIVVAAIAFVVLHVWRKRIAENA